jgi:hypothetical protein
LFCFVFTRRWRSGEDVLKGMGVDVDALLNAHTVAGQPPPPLLQATCYSFADSIARAYSAVVDLSSVDLSSQASSADSKLPRSATSSSA